MQIACFIKTIGGRLLLAVFSGLLVCALFPGINQSYLAWIALIPLLVAIDTVRPVFAFLLGLVAGFVAQGGILYWLIPLTHYNSGSWLDTVIFCGALNGYLALYTGMWAYLTAHGIRRFSPAVAVFFTAVTWVALEYARVYLFTGFPWALLGYSQWRFLPLVQFSAYAGVYGVSFIIVLVNALFHLSLRQRRWWPVVVAIAGGFLLIICGFLLLSMARARLTGNPPVRVAVLQGSIEQYKKSDAQYEQEILSVYGALAREAARQKPDVIIWPETAVPDYLPSNRQLYAWTGDTVKATGCSNIIGIQYHGDTDSDGYYNASALFTPAGIIDSMHCKTHLVPFGEYIPFRQMLAPFLGILNAIADTKPGKGTVVLKTPSATFGSALCSETFFGDVIADFARKGATVLINQTNDAWFFRTAQPEQQFTMNVFRAVENRRPLIVCGNTGISGVIDPTGAILFQTRIFERCLFLAEVRPATVKSFYTRHDDFFARLCIACTILFILAIPLLALRRKFFPPLK